MKKLTLVLIIFTILISGCNNIDESISNKTVNNDIQAERIPSQFVSEEELVKTVISFKNNSKSMVKTELRGEISNKDELDKIDYYYIPALIPENYELFMISVGPENLRNIYTEKGKDYSDPYSALELGYYNFDSGWTMKNTIKGNNLVQSKHSEKLHFYYQASIKRYSIAFFEIDSMVFYVKFPYEISLDDEKQVKMIEELCQMEKKYIE